jgi:hypothetical protein
MSADNETKYRRLLSISGTRFIARTRNLRIFNNRPAQIRNALKDMGLDGLANSLDSRFQATVSVLYTVLCPISELSQALQSPELNLLGAQDHLQLLLSQLSALRTNAEYDKCIRHAAENVPSNSPVLEVPAEAALPPKRKCRQRADLSDFVVMQALPIYSSAARRKASLEIAEYYEILDLVDQQIRSRFDNPALGALTALQHGHMTAALKDFCKLHQRDPDTVERQLGFTVMALKARQLEDKKLELHELFRYSSLQPELHYITDVALTLPVTSSCAERAFSRLRLVKSHLRTTMSGSRLQSLLRISSNKPTATKIPLESMVGQFAKSERRIIF